MHVHIPDSAFFSAFSEKVLLASASYFRAKVELKSFEQTEEELKSQGVSSYALLPVPTRDFDPQPLNQLVSSYASKSDIAIGFACVNPAREPKATIKRALDLGLAGVKLHPILQEVRPDDERLYPVYEALSDVNGVVVVHTGTSGIGAGLKGGGGFRLDFSRPIYVDNVAASFPDVNFVLAHFGWPWSTEAIAIALQKANVYLELSGWNPKYIPKEVWVYANTLLQDRVLFGSDYPFVQPKKWLEEFEKIDLKEEVKRKILYQNAEKLF
jgi:predicted TIM-barrel fold metal-dependent hydrolase